MIAAKQISAVQRAAGSATEPLLAVEDLRTHFFTRDGILRAVDGISFSIKPGETLGVVGKSGCGKSVAALSILRLVPSPGRIVAGEIRLHGRNLLDLTSDEMRTIPRKRDFDDLPGANDFAQSSTDNRTPGRRDAQITSEAVLPCYADARRRNAEYSCGFRKLSGAPASIRINCRAECAKGS